MEKKITKRQVFEALLKEIEGKETVGGLEVDVVKERLELLIEQDINKADKAKERAAKKKQESDVLTDDIFALLREDFQTADAITEAIGVEAVTKSKVVARLTKLVNTGEVEKEQVKTEDGRKLMAYRIKQDEAEADE